MRHPKARWNTGRQSVLRNIGALKNSEELVAKRAAFYAVHAQHGGVRGQTTPDGGNGVMLRPVDHLRQACPVWLIGQICGHRLRTGHDEPVELCVPECAYTRIEVTHAMSDLV